MAENKKPGFLKRLFGGAEPVDPAPVVEGIGGTVDRPVAVLRHVDHAPAPSRALLDLQRGLRAAFDPAGIFQSDTRH